MLVSKWHAHRLGIIDFWYYTNEEFYFKDGHMLLRGSNGSGKSVTMQSFIPLLLDGNRSSERLDAFGTRSRKLETYMLEEDGTRDDRIGYLYMEFKREDSNLYKTIGMGMRARKNKPLECWYFVIEDNRRVNYDLTLFENDLAISKQALKNKIGNQLIEGQRHYMERVNAALFGFKTIEEYKEAINLLVQVRSPKLSNSLRPTELNEILSNSLQSLSEEDLRPMSEAISSMDEIKDQLEVLKNCRQAATTLFSLYEQYNYAMLEGKAKKYVEQLQMVEKLKQQLTEYEQKLEVDCQQSIEVEKEIQFNKQQIKVLEEEKNSLAKNDVIELANEIEKLKNDLKQNQMLLDSKEQQLDHKENIRIDTYQKNKEIKDDLESIEHQIGKYFNDLDYFNENMDFEEHQALKQEFFNQLNQSYNFDYTQHKIKQEIELLKKGISIFKQIDTQQSFHQEYKEQLAENESEKEVELASLTKNIQVYEQVVEQYKEQFSKWASNNEVLKLNKEQLHQILNLINTFSNEDCYAKIDSIILECFTNLTRDYLYKESQYYVQINDIKKQIDELNNALDNIKSQKDLVPPMTTCMIQNRHYLTNNKIKFTPLYTLLEFNDNVDDTTQNKIEEFLSEIQLLNALIVNEKDKQQVLQAPLGYSDRYLFVQQNIDELAPYYFGKCQTVKEELLNMLMHFNIKTQTFDIQEMSYRLDFMEGKISGQQETCFIGENSRQLKRQMQIEQFISQITDAKSKQNELENELENIQKALHILNKEKNNYPTKDVLSSVKKEVTDQEDKIRRIDLEIIKINNKIKQEIDKIKQLSIQTNEISLQIGIGNVKEQFEMRLDYFEDYSTMLQEIINAHKEYLNKHITFEIYTQQLELIEHDIDNLKAEVESISSFITECTMLIESKNQQLEQIGYQEIKERLDTVLRLLRGLPLKNEQLSVDKGKLDEAISNSTSQIELIKNDLVSQQQRSKLYFDIFEEELKLRYVTQLNDPQEILEMIKQSGIVKKTKDKLVNDLQGTYQSQRGYLQEYNLSRISLFEESDIEGVSRIDFIARYKGAKLSFFDLPEKLDHDIEQQNLLVDESDRGLIENILINTISRKIRSKIQNSKHWIENMNRYMSNMNTSSGLKLSLSWTSHKALNDEELSTEHLVKLLEKDPKTLKESDFKSLSKHFQSKINTARKLAEQEESNETFHLIMKNVMDYRNWFDFKISYEKSGERKKELTNNAFYALSGGEKAMSMYIPLFSAVAAKFEGANEDAPLVIALDEAFAGVDEKNIDNMFSLINQFKFDYLMNSQVLWGDYPSVKSLAIHELFRPENAKYVTVISYEWNGKVKQLLTNDYE